MKKIFRKNKKTNILKHSYQPCDYTQNRSDSEHTQSSQTNNVGWAYLPNITKLAQTATLTLAMSFFITSPAIAQQVPPVPTLDKLNKDGVTIPDSDPEQVYPESAYKLTPIENADPENLPQNAITLYDKTEVIKYYDPQTGQEVAADDRLPDVQYKEITTIQTTPKYYTVSLKQTEYGSGDKSMTFGWEKTADGHYELKQNPTNPVGQTITYKYTETGFSESEPHQKDLGTIENPSGTSSNPTIIEGGAALNNPTGTTESIDNVLFKDNSTTGKVIFTTSSFKYVDVLGGAVYNEGTLSSVTGAFINNSLVITTETNRAFLYVNAKGGAIANSGTIENITGDFIGNYVSGTGTGSSANAYGGAIYNSGSNAEIGNITGDFIGNYVSSVEDRAYGGAIYNYSYDGSATIGDITGDFIGNYAVSTEDYARGGAIYNSGSNAEIGNITGDFIGNYASSSGTYYSIYASGGAISNDDGATIGDITGDFIGNYASSIYIDAQGGAIYNRATIGDITGDFIGNYVSSVEDIAYGGAIYNFGGTIGDITGDFIGNYVSGSLTYGGAIYNRATIGDITGDFIGNYASGSFDDGGAIYNYDGSTIGNITGDFIGNYASGSSGAYGGAIYNSGTIGDITGDFIGNYASGSSGDGGAIYNDAGATIGDITGDFIGNYASGSFGAYGGAIYNSGTIGDITGDFIGNSANIGGAVYNTETIGNITGDFIANSANEGGAVYNTGSITAITGDFIANEGSEAIYNLHTLGNITGDFIQNKTAIKNGDIVDYDINKKPNITKIKGNFIGNADSAIENTNLHIKYFRQYVDGCGGYITEERDELVCDAVIELIESSDFIGNTGTEGGAIYNLGKINEIKDTDFIGNSAEYGGAIYNEGQYVDGYEAHAQIGNITGNFVNNHATSSGGAIYNYQDLSQASIGNITGDFIQNYVEGDGWTAGGAIYNDNASIGDITGNFSQNYVLNTDGEAHGGAISNTYNATIGSKDDEGSITGGIINSNFTGNYAKSENGEAKGGAIYTTENLNIIAKDNGQSVFSGNYTESAGVKDQNAIYIETINDSYTNTDRNIISIDNNKLTFEEITGAEAPSSVPTLTLNANTNGVVVFDDTIEGNIVTTAGTTITQKTGDLIIDSYIQNQYNVSNVSDFVEYVKANPDKFWWYENNMTNEEIVSYLANNRYLKIENEQTVSTETKEGKYTYTLALDGDSTGKVVLNNDVINANISLDNTNLYLGREDVFNQSQSLSLNSGSIYMNNQSVGTMHVPTLNLNGNTNISVDADLANKSMDRITADTYNVKDNAMLNVNNVVLLSDAKEDVTNIQFADDELASNVAYTGASPIAYSPIWKYDVSYNPDDGFFTFSRGGSTSSSSAYNPAVLASPVATQAGAYTTQLQTFNYAFQHADTFMNIPYLERVAMINQGKYALSPTGDATDVGTYSPLLLKEESAGFWVKPYASFENVPLKNGPKVSNINYGTLVGYDSPLQSISNGFERVLTGYIGYNGASQRYSGVDAYQNGGLLGGTATFYKGNFFNATTLSVGASAGDASTMYGSENYTMLLAGLGNKTGYNFEFFDGGMILQPSMLISYTFVNTFDYTNGAGVRIESDPMHAIQLAPGIKLIGNTKNGWQPYIGVSMVWNLLDESKVTADSVRLPEMSIKPYVQYGVGLQKRVNDKFLAFGQAMIHNGGRNGVSLSAGLRWKIGRE